MQCCQSQCVPAVILSDLARRDNCLCHEMPEYWDTSCIHASLVQIHWNSHSDKKGLKRVRTWEKQLLVVAYVLNRVLPALLSCLQKGMGLKCMRWYLAWHWYVQHKTPYISSSLILQEKAQCLSDLSCVLGATRVESILNSPNAKESVHFPELNAILREASANLMSD